jgi:hypothetical protein
LPTSTRPQTTATTTASAGSCLRTSFTRDANTRATCTTSSNAHHGVL